MLEKEKLNFLIEETREKIKQEIAEGFFYHSDKMKKWYQTRKELGEFLKKGGDLKETNPLVYDQCLDLLNKIKWFSFVHLKSEDFIDLFRQGLKYALMSKDYPLEKNLSMFLIDIPILSVRDEYKGKIREAMFANQEKLTSKKIVMGNKEKDPTISNWLKFYDTELGAGNVEKLKTLEILFNNKNVIKLSTEEKQVIKRLIDLYEELKISAITVEGLEEEDYVIDENGEIEYHKRSYVEKISQGFAKTKKQKALKLEKEMIQEKIKAEKIKEEANLIDINQAIGEVIKRTNLTFPQEDLEKRFKNIILSFLKDVRTGIETKITLKRETQIGGMGFDQETTDKIMDILKNVKPKIDQKFLKEELLSNGVLKSELSTKMSFPAGQLDKIIQTETRQTLNVEPISKKKETIASKQEQVFKTKSKSPFVPPPIIKQTPSAPVLSEQKTIPSLQASISTSTVKQEPVIQIQESTIKKEVKPKLEEKQKTETQISLSKDIVSPSQNISQTKTEEPVKIEIPVRRPIELHKPVVEEIKVKPKTYSPIDELRTITLIDWRRWGTPKEAAKMVQNKINLLAEESLVKKAEGIKAWKSSEINQLYLNIGAESIDQGKSVNEIIIQRQQQNKPTLNEEEFNVVVELNQKLRF
ncbi:MAG: hypothetical protein PHG59_03115 [Patescibacteria group bacterium]|nr:hypothetical protein [Patescibacteria group bacterium]